MKYYTVIYLMLTLIPGSAMCQVSVDDALINSSEVMKLKRESLSSLESLHKVAFGPFKIVAIHKGKQHFEGRERDAFYEIKGREKGFRNSVSTKTSQPFSLAVIKDGGDSIITNMNLITVKGGDHALIEISNRKAPAEENISSYCADMFIQIRKDSLSWQMPQISDEDDKDFPLSFDRVLTNGTDKILVKGAEDFPVKSRLFKSSTTGIVFIYNKKQVAALEWYPEKSIWIKNSINESQQQAIAAVMISLLSITNLSKL